MKKITAALALMIAMSAYVSYPSAGARNASSTISSAMMAFDAV